MTRKPFGSLSSMVFPDVTSRTPLRPLTSLKWLYVPDESAFPEHLKEKTTSSLYNFPSMKLLVRSLALFFFLFCIGASNLNVYFMSSYICVAN